MAYSKVSLMCHRGQLSRMWTARICSSDSRVAVVTISCDKTLWLDKVRMLLESAKKSLFQLQLLLLWSRMQQRTHRLSIWRDKTDWACKSMIQSLDCHKSRNIKVTIKEACLVVAICSQCQRLLSQATRHWTLSVMRVAMSLRFQSHMIQTVVWASLCSTELKEWARSAMSCNDTQMIWFLTFKESLKTHKTLAITREEKISQRLSLSAVWTSRLVDTAPIQLRSLPRMSLKGLSQIADRASLQLAIRARLWQALLSSTRDTKLWLEAPWVKSKSSFQMISLITVAQMSVAITEQVIMDRPYRHRLQRWLFPIYRTQPNISL